jgi:EmrB/QacA subfamily drug resistance transporter
MNNQISNSNDSQSKKVALSVVVIASFLTPLTISSVNVALPSIGKEFGMNAIYLSWVAMSYLLASAMFLVPFARISDIVGRKKIFTYGTFIFTISSLFLAASFSVSMLIILRVLQGMGAAMVLGTGVAILSSVFPLGEKGKALGISTASVYLGLSVGPFLGGFITQHLGWRLVFLLNVPFGLLIIILAFWKLKGEWAEAKGEKFDLIGSLVFSLTLFSLMYGFSLLPQIAGAGLILSGFLGIFALVKWETKVKNPVLNISLFKNNTVFAFSNLAALINYSATFAVSFLLSLYLQYVKGETPQTAGIILVSQPIVQAIFSPYAGKLSDKIESRIVASIGMGLTVIGLFLFIFLDEKTSLPFIVASLALLGFGFALFSSPNTNAVMSSVEKRFYGVASGTLATMRLTGQMFSMGIAMLLFALFIGGVKITPEYYPLFLKSVKTAFIIFTVLCLGGVFASLARGNVR